MLGANSAHVGDQFIIEDGLRTVTKMSHKFTYMDNGTWYPRHMFNKWIRITLRFTNARKSVLGEHRKSKQLDAIEVKKKNIGNASPSNALRFIILINEHDEYKWYFANQYSSHTDLEKEINDEKKWRACGGGFYTAIRANAKINLDGYWRMGNFYDKDLKDTIVLFGKSDTYGLRKEYLKAALPALQEKYNVIILDDHESIKSLEL